MLIFFSGISLESSYVQQEIKLATAECLHLHSPHEPLKCNYADIYPNQKPNNQLHALRNYHFSNVWIVRQERN